MEIVGERVGVTLFLLVYGVLLSLVLTVPLAIAASLYRGRPPDHAIRVFSTAGLGFPQFWLGIMLILVFSVWLKLFPVSGAGETFVGRLHHLFLPAFTIALALSAVLTRNLRASLLAEIESDYVAAARAKGLPGAWISDLQAPCLPQLADPDHQPARREHRLADRRHRGDRDGVLGSARLAADAVDLRARLHDGAGGRLAFAFATVVGRRYRDRGPRPEDQDAATLGRALPQRRPWQIRFGNHPAVLYAGAGVVLVWFIVAIADVIAPTGPTPTI